MEDLCEKCSGWIRNSPTADMHDPETWCTCPLNLDNVLEELATEEY